MPAKILVFGHTNYQLDTRVRNQCETLAENHFVEVYAKPSQVAGNSSCLNGVKIHYVGSSRKTAAGERGALMYIWEYLAFFFTAFKACLVRVLSPPDVVIIHTMPDILVFAALPLYGRSKIVLDVHDLVPEIFEMKFPQAPRIVAFFIKLFENWSHSIADHRLTVNREIARYLSDRTGNSYQVFHNGPLELSSVKGGEGFSRQQQEHNLVFMGNIHFRYRVDALLHAVATLISEGRHIRLDIHGQGPAVKHLKDLVHAMGASKWAHIHGEYFPSDVPKILKGKSIGFVLAEHSTQNDLAIPVKLLEYASQYVPCICRGLTTTKAYFPEDAVMYFEHEEELSGAIDKLLKQERLREVLAENAHKIQQSISWPVEISEFCAFIDDVIASQ